jgi:DNA-binding transcriptional ArsR family regulator
MIALDTTFAALSDATRRAILLRLAEGEATVGELAKPFQISLPAISRHLRILEEAELIVRERAGQHRRCRLRQEALASAGEWLEFPRRCQGAALDRPDTHLQHKSGDKPAGEAG